MKFRAVPLSSYSCLLCSLLKNNACKVGGSFKTIQSFSTSRPTQSSPDTFYDILQVDAGASQEEIKESFVRLSKQLHPDRNPEKESHTDFVKLNEAYSTLKSPNKRRQYDLSLGNLGTMSSFNEFGRYRTRGFETEDLDAAVDRKKGPRGRPMGQPFEYTFHDFGNRTEAAPKNEELRRATQQRERDLRASKERRKLVEVVGLVVGLGTLVSLVTAYFWSLPSQKYRYAYDTSVRVYSSGSGGPSTLQKYVDAKTEAAEQNRRKNAANVRTKKRKQFEKKKKSEKSADKLNFDSLRSN